MKKEIILILLTTLCFGQGVSGQDPDYPVSIRQIIGDPDIPYRFPTDPQARFSTDTSGQLVIMSAGDLAAFKERILLDLVNLGYPFVEVRLDSLVMGDSLTEATVLIHAGLRVRFDSIVVRSESLVNHKILKQLTGIKRGDWYSHTKIDEANQRLTYLGLLDEAYPLEAGFFDSLAWLYLRTPEPKANRFDGSLGFLPGELRQVPRMTGELDLRLSNIFHQMEQVNFHWRSPGNESQRLNASLVIPYIFATSMGLSSDIHMYKRDSSYLVLGGQVAARMNFTPGNWIEIRYTQRQSRQLNPASTLHLDDYRLQMTGVKWRIDQTNSRLAPDKGWLFEQSVGLGKKWAESNLPSDNQSAGFYWETDALMNAYIPLSGFWTVFLQASGGYRHRSSGEHEGYWLGGANGIRGFQEESFHSNGFVSSKLELRFGFSTFSHFHAFIDGGWINQTGYVYAPGLGLTVETRAGLLNLDYALGQVVGHPFSLKSGLIHLGIQSNF